MNVRQLLLETPTLGLLRGRVGRLGWKRRVKASGLPADVQQTIRRIAGQWRLFRRERSRIADELIAHFHDGGKLSDFGDVNSARKLFRKTMIAKRGWWWPVCKGVAVAVALLVGYHGFLAFRFFTGTPIVETDYVAMIRAEVGPPLTDGSGAKLNALFDEAIEAKFEQWDRHEPETHGLQDSERAWLLERQDLIARMRAAAKLPVGWKLWVDDAGSIVPGTLPAEVDTRTLPAANVMLSELNAARGTANIVLPDARLAATENDPERALADLDAILSLAHELNEMPIVVNTLVASAIHASAMQTTGDIVDVHGGIFTDEQLRALAHRLASVKVTVDLRGERWMAADFLQRVYEPGEDGRLTSGLFQAMEPYGSEPMHDPVGRGLLPDLLYAPQRGAMEREFEIFFDRTELEMTKPLWELPVMDTDSYLPPVTNTAHLALRSILPSLGRVRWVLIGTGAQRDGVLLGIALELYHRDNDAWPATLAELVPMYIPSLPVDPFTGEALKYRVTDDGPLVYSVGGDGDDDGGRPGIGVGDEKPSMYRIFQGGEPLDGDVPLWPPLP